MTCVLNVISNNSYSLTGFPRKSLNPVPSHVPIKSINQTEQ